MTGVPDLAAWLTEAIGERKAAAQAASSGHLCPDARDGRWQVVGSRHVTYGNGAGETFLAVDVTGGPCLWYEQVWVRGDPDGAVAAHIAANGPADVIARCEAELAILDEHAQISGYCTRCAQDEEQPQPAGWWLPWPCRTVRLLGSGYRGRPGYREEWAP